GRHGAGSRHRHGGIRRRRGADRRGRPSRRHPDRSRHHPARGRRRAGSARRQGARRDVVDALRLPRGRHARAGVPGNERAPGAPAARARPRRPPRRDRRAERSRPARCRSASRERGAARPRRASPAQEDARQRRRGGAGQRAQRIERRFVTLDQALAFAVLIGMMALFVWGRIRYDLVALVALLVSIAVGIVPAEEAFAGFGNDILVIVATALLVSAAVSRSGVVDVVVRRASPYLRTPTAQVVGLAGTVALLSAFVKNIGALAMLIPVALQLARRSGTPPAYLLMPMAFVSLLGGMMTLIGTSPNIIVSQMREEIA